MNQPGPLAFGRVPGGKCPCGMQNHRQLFDNLKLTPLGSENALDIYVIRHGIIMLIGLWMSPNIWSLTMCQTLGVFTFTHGLRSVRKCYYHSPITNITPASWTLCAGHSSNYFCLWIYVIFIILLEDGLLSFPFHRWEIRACPLSKKQDVEKSGISIKDPCFVYAVSSFIWSQML